MTSALFKEERQSWKEELKHEFQGWSSKVSTTLEEFEGELSQVAGKIQNVQNSVEALQRDKLKPAELVNLKNAWEPWNEKHHPWIARRRGQ